MARSALTAIAVSALALIAAPAWACGCNKEAGAGGAKASQSAKPAPQPNQAAQTPTLEEPLAAKCSCESAADCTCKKGDCKCAKCSHGGTQRIRMIESLKGEAQPLVVPENARRDATAGVFI